jgi:hypothetical protein
MQQCKMPHMINKVEYYDLMQLSVWKDVFLVVLHIMESYDGMLVCKQHKPLDYLLTKKFTLPALRLHR